jgi:TRAP-type uncharacterized transport system fused permease subunit
MIFIPARKSDSRVNLPMSTHVMKNREALLLPLLLIVLYMISSQFSSVSSYMHSLLVM